MVQKEKIIHVLIAEGICIVAIFVTADLQTIFIFMRRAHVRCDRLFASQQSRIWRQRKI